MGLDVSHDAFHGAYSAFNQLRGFIAKATGGSFPPHADKTLDANRWYFGEGYTNKTHPGLFAFLCHSDCDGKIHPKTCTKIASELEALLPTIEKLAETNDVGAGHLARDGGYIAVTKKFIVGCRAAATERKSLRFY